MFIVMHVLCAIKFIMAVIPVASMARSRPVQSVKTGCSLTEVYVVTVALRVQLVLLRMCV